MPGPGLPTWRLHVLDLATLEDSPVAEPRFIDEQVVWLDNSHILYTQTAEWSSSPAVTDVWMVAADGSGEPQVLLRAASSPVPLAGDVPSLQASHR